MSKNKNVPKVINFDSDQTIVLAPKEKAIKKDSLPLLKKTVSDVEFHDLDKRIKQENIVFNWIDYCVEKPIEKPAIKPIVKPVVVKPKQVVEEKPIKKIEEPIKQQPEKEVEEVIAKPIIEKPILKKQIIEQPKESIADDSQLFVNKNDVLLEVTNLRKQYSRKAKPAIDQLNFKVLRGQFHAFIGANGAGKTTTIKSIVGAYAKFEGDVKISGLSNKEKMSKAKLGYIPEIARFPSRISAFKYLKSMAMLNRLSSKEAEEFTKKILIEFKMYDLKDVSPNKFSSGQKKKILLAQALSNDPDILIMDEPAANLDPKARIDFFNILKGLQRKGKAIFISSHILSELDLYADSLTILDGGKIVYTGIRTDEVHDGHKYAYRVNLIKEDDFGTFNTKEFTIEKNPEDPKHYIVSSNDKISLDNFLTYLIKNQKAEKVEVYRLSIEDMYKKYVIFGSVHTGYKMNANSSLEQTDK